MSKKEILLCVEQTEGGRSYSILPANQQDTRIAHVTGTVWFGIEKRDGTSFCISSLKQQEKHIERKVGSVGYRFISNFTDIVKLESHEQLIVVNGWTFMVAPPRSDGDQEIDTGVKRAVEATLGTTVRFGNKARKRSH